MNTDALWRALSLRTRLESMFSSDSLWSIMIRMKTVIAQVANQDYNEPNEYLMVDRRTASVLVHKRLL